MTTRNTKKKGKSPKPGGTGVETENRAPQRRGGTAMGRTVGMPFGGARPRKRKTGGKRSSKTK